MTEKFKVLLIYPNTMMATLVPINISQLYACLKEKDFEVFLFDTTYYPTEEISVEERKVELLQIKEFNLKEKGVIFKKTDIHQDLKNMMREVKPDLVGITLVEDTWELGQELLKDIKEFNAPVIAGGVFVTFSPEEVISNEAIDMVCLGEGEETLVELCSKMAQKEDYTNINNLWIKRKGRIFKNTLRRPTDINQLPYIDYDIFEPERLYRPMYGKIYTMIHVEIDRGCPYQCAYCEAPSLKRIYAEYGANSYYRKKQPDRLFSEITHLTQKYKPDYINFDCESFLARSVEELKEFARYYKKIGLPFWCQSRPETISEEKIKTLKEMGCQNLQFGIEQGNEEFRGRILNRKYSNTKVIEGLKIVEKYRIKYTVNNIIGFPEETRNLIFDTIALNRQVNPRTINCYIFAPYKGTPIYEYCLKRFYINEDTKINQLLDGAELMNQPITHPELKGLQRTFPLYCRMPQDEWNRIKIAEQFNDQGNEMFQELRKVYYERYFE